MKQLLLLAGCFLAITASFAQKNMKPANKGKHRANKNAIGGTIRDAHRQPIMDVEAFVYNRVDTSISASGFTDSMGNYETSSLLPGKYDLKLVYPNEKNAMVTGIIVKKGITPINLTMDAPPSDTLILYVELLPKPAPKKKPEPHKKK